MKNKMEVIGNIYQAGVYGIRVKGEEGCIYVGSALEINDALSRHVYYLKRGLYADTNKAKLQEYYDMDSLEFIILHESEQKDKIRNMSTEEKENLDAAMSVLEVFYINLYKDTVCNKQKGVTKHSSNKDEFSTIRRSKSNIGANNPNSKYTEELISNILWLKIEGYKAKNIMEILKEKGIDIRSQYINQIGLTKWIYAQAVKPTWIEKDIECTGILSISDTNINISL